MFDYDTTFETSNDATLASTYTVQTSKTVDTCCYNGLTISPVGYGLILVVVCEIL